MKEVETLKARLIELINQIESIRVLEYLYQFTKKAVTVWK